MTSSQKDNEPHTVREKISAYIDVGLTLGLLISAGVMIAGPPEFAGIALRTSNILNRIANYRGKRRGGRP